MVTWILEQNVFSEKCFDSFIEAFKKHDIKYHVVKIIPFIHEIEGKIPLVNDKVICYGSIGIQKLAKAQNWKPGVFTNDSFNYWNYKNAIGDDILNADCILTKISMVEEVCRTNALETFFIKPNGDTKEFAGEVMNINNFATWYNKMISIGYLENNDFDVVISKPKEIKKEWRAVVINGKISSMSLYRNYGQAYVKEEFDIGAANLISRVNKTFMPDDVFVIDIGETLNGLKVIEYNTFNSAGLYDCNVEKIILDMNEFIEGY